MMGENGDTLKTSPGPPLIHFIDSDPCASQMVTLFTAGTINSCICKIAVTMITEKARIHVGHGNVHE